MALAFPPATGAIKPPSKARRWNNQGRPKLWSEATKGEEDSDFELIWHVPNAIAKKKVLQSGV